MSIPRGWFAVPSAVVVVALIGLSVGSGHGDALPAAPRAAEDGKCFYVGVGVCARCHEHPRKQDDTDYVSLTEYPTWSEKDKHAKAYRVLTEASSQRMGELLGWKHVEEDARCLSCHAANIPKELRRNDFTLHDGVSCEICHGPASEWIVPHLDKKWRITASADKKKLGMHNVRDPLEQSRLCVSCHVGNVAEGKEVTHEMYAAGHPPLPSFEISSFCDKMPPHWRPLRDKPKPLQQQIRAAFKMPQDERTRTKLTVMGAVTVFQASMDLLNENRGAERSPELAHYDCSACHHELRLPSWRQKRGYLGPPGRPSMHQWPTVLLQDALRFAADPALAKQYDERLHKLRQAFDARPFGEAKQIAESANQLREWSDRLLVRLQEVPYDAPASRRLLRGLCTAKDADKYDYNSACQKAWAIDAIAKELKVELPPESNQQTLRTFSEKMGLVKPYDPNKFQSALEKWRSLLPQE